MNKTKEAKKAKEAQPRNFFTLNPTPLDKKLLFDSVPLHRNTSCPYYDSCLYKMAILDSRSWTCWFCTGKTKETQEAQVQEVQEAEETQEAEALPLIPLTFTEAGAETKLRSKLRSKLLERKS